MVKDTIHSRRRRAKELAMRQSDTDGGSPQTIDQPMDGSALSPLTLAPSTTQEDSDQECV